MPGGLIAKLHSLVPSNSDACLSFITLRTSSIVCCGVSAVFETGAILPSTLIAGGKSAVRNRSEPLREIMKADDTQDAAREPMRLMDAAAAWQVGNVLLGTPPPENAARNRIAFKTGTSYGYRDAWSVGFDGKVRQQGASFIVGKAANCLSIQADLRRPQE